jgi:hypothetical protein
LYFLLYHVHEVYRKKNIKEVSILNIIFFSCIDQLIHRGYIYGNIFKKNPKNMILCNLFYSLSHVQYMYLYGTDSISCYIRLFIIGIIL